MLTVLLQYLIVLILCDILASGWLPAGCNASWLTGWPASLVYYLPFVVYVGNVDTVFCVVVVYFIIDILFLRRSSALPWTDEGEPAITVIV
jgi:hypothetical protein